MGWDGWGRWDGRDGRKAGCGFELDIQLTPFVCALRWRIWKHTNYVLCTTHYLLLTTYTQVEDLELDSQMTWLRNGGYLEVLLTTYYSLLTTHHSLLMT